MTIFVTGGAGYIGSHAVLELLESGHDVVVCDNFSNGRPEALAQIKELSGREFVFYEADVRDYDKLDLIFSSHKIDCVMHFAGLKAVGESVAEPLKYYANNLESTISLCSIMLTHGVWNIIFSSSASVYYGGNEMPLREDSIVGNCTNPYAYTKLMCEQILKDTAAVNSDFSAVILRYFNVIGAHKSGELGEDPQGIPNNLVPYIAQTAVGRREVLSVYGDDYETPDGTCIRDYIHVEDLIRGHVAALDYANKNKGAAVFNLGTGKGSSNLEVIKAFEDASGVIINKKNAPRRPGDWAIAYAAPDKAEKELNWSAKKTLENAMADLWRFQSRYPDGYKE